MDERTLTHADLIKQKQALERWLDDNGWPYDTEVSAYLDQIQAMLDRMRDNVLDKIRSARIRAVLKRLHDKIETIE